MASTIFTKIIAGQLPAYRIYEDHLLLVILDIAPLAEGHMLLIPKEPAVTIADLSEQSSAAIGKLLPKLAKALRQITGCQDFHVLCNNGVGAYQSVPHVHFHLIPKPGPSSGLSLQWHPSALTAAQGEQLCQDYQACLANLDLPPQAS